MASNTTLTTFDPALKQIYSGKNLQKVVYQKRPLLGKMAKFEGFGGRNMPIVLVYGDPQGVSATFATAQANYTSILSEDFVMTRVSKYSIGRIDSEVVEATRGDNMAFLSALKAKIDGAINALANSMETDLYRAGRGGICQIINSGVAANDVTVANPMVITLDYAGSSPHFEVGMVLEASATDGAAARTTPATGTVVLLDRVAGTITTGYDNSGAATNWAPADFLRRAGDDDAVMSGLAAWCPAATPAATAFFGVDRTVDGRLYGQAYNGSSDKIEDSLIEAQSMAAQEDGAADCVFLHHTQVRRLIRELGAKKEYSESFAVGPKGTIASVGYKGVVVQGDYGPIECYAANKCQVTTGWLLTSSVWALNTLGPAPKFLMEDNLRMLRISNEDAYEVRLGMRGNVSCKAPNWNVNITLPAPA